MHCVSHFVDSIEGENSKYGSNEYHKNKTLNDLLTQMYLESVHLWNELIPEKHVNYFDKIPEN